MNSMNDSDSRPNPPQGSGLDALVELVRLLRGPEGCPWDREQSLDTVRAYLLEEAHEAAAAIDSGDLQPLASELGDLLFMTAFTAELCRERGGPPLPKIVRSAIDKLVTRHPHVFAGETHADADAVHRAWEQRKQSEKEASGESLLDGVARTLPALAAAYRLGQKASGIGFDWREPRDVLEKLDEERQELDEALSDGAGLNRERLVDEVGDVLFTLASVARHLNIDPEAALATANQKFRRRFQAMESICRARGVTLSECSSDQLEALWNEAKARISDERNPP